MAWDDDLLKAYTGSATTAAASNKKSGLDKFINPYLSNVLGTSLDTLADQGQNARNSLNSNAFSAGALGDARNGVESASLTKDLLKTAGDLSSQVAAQGYDSAMGYKAQDWTQNFQQKQADLGWENTDIDRQTNVALQNAGLQNQWFNNYLNAASTGSTIANNTAGLGSNYADLLTSLDKYDRDWTQQGLNADYDNFWAGQNWDATQLNSLVSVLNGVPGQTGTSTSTPSNQWASILGSLASSNSGLGSLFSS